MTLAYKILTRAEEEEFVARGTFAGSDDDLADGFIHLSTADQLAGTLRRHFADRHDLVLLAVDLAHVAAMLRWEPSRGGALFPHLYGALARDAVTASVTLERGRDGAPVLPPE